MAHLPVVLVPGIAVEERGAGLVLTTPAGHAIAVQVHRGQVALVSAQYAPRFGVVLPTQCLAVTLVDGHGEVEFSWEGGVDAG